MAAPNIVIFLAGAANAQGNGNGGGNGNGNGGGNGNGNGGGNGNGNGAGNGNGNGGGNGNGNGKGKAAGKGAGASASAHAASRSDARPASPATRVSVVHHNGMSESVRGGRYEMRDAKGRLIVRRQATVGDVLRLDHAADYADDH